MNTAVKPGQETVHFFLSSKNCRFIALQWNQTEHPHLRVLTLTIKASQKNEWMAIKTEQVFLFGSKMRQNG